MSNTNTVIQPERHQLQRRRQHKSKRYVLLVTGRVGEGKDLVATPERLQELEVFRAELAGILEVMSEQ